MSRKVCKSFIVLLVIGGFSFLPVIFICWQMRSMDMKLLVHSYLLEVFRNGDGQSFREAVDVINKTIDEKSLCVKIDSLMFRGKIWNDSFDSIDRIRSGLRNSHPPCMLEVDRKESVCIKDAVDILKRRIASSNGVSNEVYIVSMRRGDLIADNWINSNCGKYIQIGYVERCVVNHDGSVVYSYPDRGCRHFVYMEY